ncbi:MAG: TraR/DksA C4-type zinc finger protein [Candidatus Nealsonbacteria bacterium]
MNKKELKEKLEQEKEAIEKQLETFATRDPNLKGDWDSRFPKFDGNLEEAADEVEEYGSRLPVEFSLETRLRDIGLALEKLTRGKYGKCEKCAKNIENKRLEVYPAARFCMKCSPR